MLCTKVSRENEAGTVPVYLNVYDLTPINGYAYWFGLGAYHSGVQGEPKKCEGFTYRKTILIGKTGMEQAEVRAVMEELGGEYRGNAYNLITKNCNHFCNDACVRLTGNPIPSWVNRLARIGFLCKCVIPATLNSTKIRHHRIEDKPCEEEEEEKKKKKKVTSDSNRVISSNSSSSSSLSPSSSTIRRGRSRNRSRRKRALPPSSP
ncbi:hypothetical protein F2P56_028195 [Juglans regia]|uniref:PPPDE domain-containing protein n=2 Tax=Juglans regia TaxID=51240 RepID=A0A833U949_JUGRE|nr:deSI-like protein At4g17486 isoform X2 [Juglans regia]KAF5453282.1 hypothetical protein F2P56_028195 [Juglans regia]